MLSSMSRYLDEFPDWNTLSWINHCMCLTNKSLFFIPISHDDPDGIILSNFMLVFVCLNSSNIKPPSFHLPFISHPSFMALVRLKRSWFNCRTIFTSHVCQAIKPSLFLQKNFQLAFVGTADALAISYHD